jgi:hypothetical protein
MIYKGGILAISDEDLADLGWDPKQLLELEHDGIGWTVRPSSCATGRATPNESKRDKNERPVADKPSLVRGSCPA